MKLLNDPTDDWLAKLGGAHKPFPDLEKTIKILNEHAHSLPFSDVFEHLSDDIPVHRVKRFLVVALETVVSGKRRNQLNRGILYARSLQVNMPTLFDTTTPLLLTAFKILTRDRVVSIFNRNILSVTDAATEDILPIAKSRYNEKSQVLSV